MSARILAVDDDAGILDVLRYLLSSEGFEVETASDGEEALAAASRRPFDLVLLDVMLPGLSGTEVCRRLREADNTVPIIMLTARDAEVDRVLNLELGADDYIPKPFSKAELVSRVRALLRRREYDRADPSAAIRQLGGLRLDLGRHQLVVDERPVTLTPSEFKLLALLAEQPERVFTRRQIMQHLWESEYVGDEHSCDVCTSRTSVGRSSASPAVPTGS